MPLNVLACSQRNENKYDEATMRGFAVAGQRFPISGKAASRSAQQDTGSALPQCKRSSLQRPQAQVHSREKTVFDAGMNALGQTTNVRANSAYEFSAFFCGVVVLEQSCDVRFKPSTDIALGLKSDRPVSVHGRRHDRDHDRHRPRPRPSRWFRLFHRERVCAAFHPAGRSRTCYLADLRSCRRTHPAECARL